VSEVDRGTGASPDDDNSAASLRRAFEADGLTWDETWRTIADLDPQFAEAYRNLRAVPWRRTSLSTKFKCLVELTVSAAATHLHLPQIGPALSQALEAGATPAEVLEVLELSATVGIHAMNIGVPLLVEVLEERGRTGPSPLNEHQEDLKRTFTETRGYWHAFWDEMLELDPQMFEAYVEFSSVPWRTGTLSPAEKELIYISYDVAATHLYVPGTKLHIRNALDHGATVEQVLEVMELASLLGIHGVTATVPLLLDERRRRDPGAWTDDTV